MSNKKQTSVQEAIDLIKQDYEANGRLRLAFVLQTLNKAKEKETKNITNAYMAGAENKFTLGGVSSSDYYKDNFETREAENCKE